MTGLRHRSLVRRLLLGFTVVLLSIWLAILSWDLAEMTPTQKMDAQRELAGTAHRILAVVQAISDQPDAIPAVVAKMEKLHHIFYIHSWGQHTPKLQTQVWKGADLLYTSVGTSLRSKPVSAEDQRPAGDGWLTGIATDPKTGITVRMDAEFIGQWTILGFSSVGYYFNPLLFSLPLLLLPAWLIIRVGLRPLNSIGSEIEARSGVNLSPLCASPYAELSPLVRSVNRLMERLTERLEREQEFLVDAAHEIKTPLAIIQINADSLCAMDPLSNPDAKTLIQEAIEGLRQGVDRASHTVQQLVTLSRSGIDPNKIVLQPINFIELLRHHFTLAMHIAAPRNIQLFLHAPERCMLSMHRESMASVIDNLLSNAVKYSPNYGHIDVSVAIDGQYIRLTVADQGPGVAHELRKKVFERFYRLPDQDTLGSGLGLAIAARAAANNSGTIHLEAGSEGVGCAAIATFFIDSEQDSGNSHGSAVPKNRHGFLPLLSWVQLCKEKIQGIRHRSLFRRMLLGFMTVVTGIWLGYLGWNLMVDTKTVKIVGMQGELQRTSQRIGVVMQALADRPDKIAPVVKKIEELHYVFYKQRGWYTPPLQTQIWKGGALFYATAGPRLPPTLASAGPSHQPMKSGWISWIETDPQTGITVRMASELVADWFFDRASIGYFLKPLLFCLPILLILAWLIIQYGLRPLNIIVKEIENRSASNLSPLTASPYAELSPLVNSVNRLMERLTQRLEREQEFLVDAANELQAPLASIQNNLHSLNNAHHPELRRQAADGLRHDVTQATRTVHQLLAFSRAGSDRAKGGLQAINLIELLRGRLALAMQVAMQRGIRIALYSPDSCMLPLHRESMVSLIDNVIDNAVRYSPGKAKISVSVGIDKQYVQLTVTDKGPGIAPELREKVFERFYRHSGPGQETCNGLGLAIAARSATRNFGTIHLETGKDGVGLTVVVIIPINGDGSNNFESTPSNNKRSNGNKSSHET